MDNVRHRRSSLNTPEIDITTHAPKASNRTSRAIVDWTLLLNFNPPPGYVNRRVPININADESEPDDDIGISAKAIDEQTDDKVVVILQSILRSLEKEIRDDKRRLRKKRRAEKEHNRTVRRERLTFGMTTNATRHKFPTVPSALSSRSSFSSTDEFPWIRRQQHQLNNSNNDSFRTVSSMNRRLSRKEGTNSLGSEWSRYARDTNNVEVRNSDVENSANATEDESSVDIDHDKINKTETDENNLEDKSCVTSKTNELQQTTYNTNFDDTNDNITRDVEAFQVELKEEELSKTKRLMLRKQKATFDILPTYKKTTANKNRLYSSDSDGSITYDTDAHRRKTSRTTDTSARNATHKDHLDNTSTKPNSSNTNNGTINKRRNSQGNVNTEVREIERINSKNYIKHQDRFINDKLQADVYVETRSPTECFKAEVQFQIGDDGSLSEDAHVYKHINGYVFEKRKSVELKRHRNLTLNDKQSYLEHSCQNIPNTKVRVKHHVDKSVETFNQNTNRASGIDDNKENSYTQNVINSGKTTDKAKLTLKERKVFGEEGNEPNHIAKGSGTVEYPTEEHSFKTCDLKDETVQPQQKKPNKYFIILPNGRSMALKVDNSRIPDQEKITQSSLPLHQSVSMTDLAIPDHTGWLTDQSEQRKVWGVAVDMLFCVFDSEESEKPVGVHLLPGCSIRPLVYKTAINGLNTNQTTKTITGIAKFQFVIDNSSTGKKHLFSVESQAELDTWFNVLKRASTLDPEVTTDITTSGRRGSLDEKRLSFDENMSKTGYKPTQDSPNRVQKMSSPRGLNKSDLNTSMEESSSSLYNGNHTPSSPRGHGLVRTDSRRQSVQDFKKRLRKEQPEPEISKQQPVKAQHFKSNTQNQEIKQAPEKKLRSFGSFESLLKFKMRWKRKDSEDSTSNDDTGSLVSESSIEQDNTSKSVDISARKSPLKKLKSKQLSRSLELSQPKAEPKGLVRRASDIKDTVFQRRSSKHNAKLCELKDVSMCGFLHHKYHLKWQKVWCVVCRGCFYGFKTQSGDENAQISVILANIVVVYVAEKDKRQKRIYVFKLSQENKRSIYLCASDYKEFQQWLTVLQMESNSVVTNAHNIRPPKESESDSICSSVSSQSGSILSIPSGSEIDTRSRARSKTSKKRAPDKPVRHSSCPPSVSRDSLTSAANGNAGHKVNSESSSSHDEDQFLYGSQETLSKDESPRHDKALTHVWQNDRGYLFNVIRAKLKSYRKNRDGDIYNRDLHGVHNEGLLVVQDGGQERVQSKGSKEVRRTRSFNAETGNIAEIDQRLSSTPTESPTYTRKRHKPLVVKKIAARDLEEKQTLAGYLERKGFNAQWMKYWYVLHEGTLFCYLTSDDHVTVDVLNLHGYSVTSLVDKFRGKRFVLQLSHENFTSLYLSIDSREEMEHWRENIDSSLQRPSSSIREEEGDNDAEHAQGECAGCENNRKEDVGEKRKEVKQKLLEEMLRQKRELERKQALRQKKQHNKDAESPDRSPNSSYMNEFMTDDQRTSDVTRLRQRRLSTQLKVDTINKQITKPNNGKRGLFGFGKAKKLDENKNVFLQDQLKELNEKLHKIDTNLTQVKQEKQASAIFDVNQNTKSLSTTLSAEFATIERHGSDDDVSGGRANSIKATMQKWTNRKFSTKNRSTPSSKMPHNGSAPDISLKQNGDAYFHINGYDKSEGESTVNVDFESSVTDLTRPTSDLKLDLNVCHSENNGAYSPTSAHYSRSHSRTSTVSSVSSPRKEIDPSVLAEIDAFEELTRQVLGARSKEIPTKKSDDI